MSHIRSGNATEGGPLAAKRARVIAHLGQTRRFVATNPADRLTTHTASVLNHLTQEPNGDDACNHGQQQVGA